MTEDFDYIVQGTYEPEGYILETYGSNDESMAIKLGKAMFSHPTFAGDAVRVITRDGGLVWSSKDECNF